MGYMGYMYKSSINGPLSIAMSNYQRVMHENGAAMVGPDEELHLRFWAPNPAVSLPPPSQTSSGWSTSTASPWLLKLPAVPVVPAVRGVFDVQ